MNIHLPAILGFTRYQGFDPSPYEFMGSIHNSMSMTMFFLLVWICLNYVIDIHVPCFWTDYVWSAQSGRMCLCSCCICLVLWNMDLLWTSLFYDYPTCMIHVLFGWCTWVAATTLFVHCLYANPWFFPANLLHRWSLPHVSVYFSNHIPLMLHTPKRSLVFFWIFHDLRPSHGIIGDGMFRFWCSDPMKNPMRPRYWSHGHRSLIYPAIKWWIFP